MKKFLLSVLMLSFFSLKVFCTDFPSGKFYFSGGLNLGYTFGAGFTFGYEFNAGYHTFQNGNEPINAGLTCGRYWVRVNYRKTHYLHRIKFIGAMAESNYFDVKLGWGQARNKWGRGGSNHCRVSGIYSDVSFTT